MTEPTPAALDVARRLRALVVGEGYEPGERLGDERTLAARLDVPRARLRAGLEVLERAGEVRRTLGRTGGVLVADGRVERHLNTTESLPEIARRQGVDVTTRVLHTELGLALPPERRRLRLADARDGAATVWRVLRVRHADGRPLSLERTVLPAHPFPDLDRQDLTTLYGTLRDVYDVVPVLSDEQLDVRAADDEGAAHLDVRPGTPLLRVRRVATDATGRPMELGEELFVTDRVRFHLRTFGRVHRPAHVAALPDALPDAPAPPTSDRPLRATRPTSHDSRTPALTTGGRA